MPKKTGSHDPITRPRSRPLGGDAPARPAKAPGAAAKPPAAKAPAAKPPAARPPAQAPASKPAAAPQGQAPASKPAAAPPGQPPAPGSPAALQRPRSARPEEVRRKRPGVVGRANLDKDEDDEDAPSRVDIRTRLLGDGGEDSSFDQARREARLLGSMESQGEAPTRIVSQMNEQLGGGRGREFKRLLSSELKPQLERLAEQVHHATTEDRRKIAALVARAAQLAGSESAATFEKLLAATANAEARHLAASAGAGAIMCADEFQSALRRGGSLTYRAVLIEKGREHIESLAREAFQLPGDGLRAVLVALLGAAESLGRTGCTAMAKAFVAGALGRKQPGVADRLVQTIGVALPEAFGGGPWVVWVMLDLVERGEKDAAQALASLLQQHVREARERCGPLLRAVQTAADKQDLLTQSLLLDEKVGPLVALMPTCALVLAARGQVPGGGTRPLVTEGLLAIATLDAVGATETGQRMLRQTLILEAQGEPSFLGIVPVTSPPLGHPQMLALLNECGLFVPHYQQGGGLFIQRVARQVARALGGPVLARSQKGDTEEAEKLLKSAIRNHAALFGMNSNGGRLAAEQLEALRSNPQPDQAPRVLKSLEDVARRHPSQYRTGYVESLRGLVTALAERNPNAAPKSPGNRMSPGAAPVMSASSIERTYIVDMRTYEAQREAKRAEEAAKAAAAAKGAGKLPGKLPVKPPVKPAAGPAAQDKRPAPASSLPIGPGPFRPRG